MYSSSIMLTSILFLLVGCKNSDKILSGKNFDQGEWLFVNYNGADRTLELIDDEAILKSNKNGVWVSPMGDCGGTTCDGFLMLYKDGIMIAEDEYLTRGAVYESRGIMKAYKKGEQWTIPPIDEKDFQRKWDSLKNAKCYPTVYHAQPADKDIIWVYRHK